MVSELQPDITAPGVEILAAYSLDAPPSHSQTDTRRVRYSVISGTSMSCPHVAGVAAYVKTFNPKWSPSMIHSAIMTTGKQNSIQLIPSKLTFMSHKRPKTIFCNPTNAFLPCKKPLTYISLCFFPVIHSLANECYWN